MMNDAIISGLADRGWAVCENYFSAPLIESLRADMNAAGAHMKQAAVGRAQGAQVQAAIRTDSTLWLTGETAAQADYLRVMDSLRTAINENLFLGLFDFEAHYAQYDAGGFYKKHIDALHGAKNRVVSTVTYLTPDWNDTDEGHLVLYASEDEDREIARILPRAGTLAVFLSEEIPHEVLPPRRPRQSIAGWFRCNPSSGNRVDPLK